MRMNYLEARKPENRVKFVRGYVKELTDWVRWTSSALHALRHSYDSPATKPGMKLLLAKRIRQQERFLKKFEKMRVEAIESARRNNIPLPPQAQLPSERRQFKEGLR